MLLDFDLEGVLFFEDFLAEEPLFFELLFLALLFLEVLFLAALFFLELLFLALLFEPLALLLLLALEFLLGKTEQSQFGLALPCLQ